MRRFSNREREREILNKFKCTEGRRKQETKVLRTNLDIAFALTDNVFELATASFKQSECSTTKCTSYPVQYNELFTNTNYQLECIG